MQVSVETIKGLERRLTITVPADTIDSAVEAGLREEAKRAKVDGFRKGKVPVSIIKKRYGAAVRGDVTQRVVERHFIDAIVKEKLNPAGAPRFEITKDETGSDFEFTATFEVYPEVELKGLDTVEVEKPAVEIKDEDMAKMLETLQKQHASWVESDKAAADGDRVTIDFVGSIDGEEFEGGKAEGFQLQLGQGRMIPGFEDGIIGKKAGEELVSEVTFPEDYHAENLKGKAASFAIKVSAVEVQELPELTDEFATRFGIAEGGIDALKAEVLKNMERELNNVLRNKVKEQVLDGLIKANDVEVPAALVAQEVDNLRRQALSRFGGNVNANNLPELPAELFEEQARRRVQVGLLLGEVIRSEDIKVDDARVQELIANQASAYEDPAEVIKYFNENKETIEQMRNLALEEQAVDAILAKAKVSEKAAAFDEIMNNGNQG
ncbi:MAG: trigger factor [Pseudomonadota bacterium]|uniref:Trigger factor n=1 Tax=Gallaecimonas pentaromativorans TaxID=584787 RepID=A0A3N1PD37_9GAMM|nr:trigger factor [Gallaecimonas pentaromativorans]MED5524105.1 trigger factor [Pseudomonadota bacterium]ROQ29864.1 trigger factor [Gallaecimonas pentaromativorans]